MDTRFAHLYQRDSSVSMLRVKMSRRRSQTQKENRERTINQRRGLDKLEELEASTLELSTIHKPLKILQENTHAREQATQPSSAVEERKKMLARYKEAKELQKEKERREREKKGVFKVGLYRPQPLSTMTQTSAVPCKGKPIESGPNIRVTRSMKQLHQVSKGESQVTRKVEQTVVKVPRSRAADKVQKPSAAGRAKPVPETTLHVPLTRAAAARQAATGDKHSGPTTRGSKKLQDTQRKEEKPAAPLVKEAPTPSADGPKPVEEREEKEEEAVPAPASFAPSDFVFQAPAGLKSFHPKPMTRRSADAFLTPSPTVIGYNLSFSPLVHPPPAEDLTCSPPPKLQSSPPLQHEMSSPVVSEEPLHDVSYFRSVMASETAKLTGLCELWEQRTEDPAVPEEMRDAMRTAVGQARLLMKERFSQFQGLVDDCALGRGEKITTCTDLQGFWDMVYFQVEDVIRKFGALKEAESRGWQEEQKPRSRPKKTVRKPPPAQSGAKSGAETGASAAAKSRLAAVKAAMKAKRAACTESSQPTARDTVTETTPCPAVQATVVFHGGFFKVESPAKVSGCIRRSTRLSRALSPGLTPKCTTPSRARSLAVDLPLPPQPGTPLPHVSRLFCQDTPSSPVGSGGEVAETQGSPTEATQDPSSPASVLFCQPIQKDVCDSCQPVPQLALCLAEHPESIISEATVRRSPMIDQSELTSEKNTSLTLSPCPKPDTIMPTRLSFSLSPLSTPAHTQADVLPLLDATAVGPATPSCLPSLSLSNETESASLLAVADVDMSASSDTSCTENVASLDFERYVQPTLRCSLSPQPSVAMESSPVAASLNMESPVPRQDGLGVADMTHMSLIQMTKLSSDLAAGSLLLFTPEHKDRVRQSVCERDLMMFTPPSSH